MYYCFFLSIKSIARIFTIETYIYILIVFCLFVGSLFTHSSDPKCCYHVHQGRRARNSS